MTATDSDPGACVCRGTRGAGGNGWRVAGGAGGTGWRVAGGAGGTGWRVAGGAGGTGWRRLAARLPAFAAGELCILALVLML